MRFRPIAFTILSLACAVDADAQGTTLVGVVAARGTGERLGYSIVSLPTIGVERFSTDSGLFVFGDLSPGSLPLKVRRLGFAPIDTFVTIAAGQPDTVRIELARVPMRLESITVRAQPTCPNPGPPRMETDSALAIVFTQLRMNAEQYRFLARQYPFVYTMEVVMSSRMKKDGDVRIDGRHVQTIAGESGRKYRPGHVVNRRGRNYFFIVPTLVDFADREFLAQHCFHYGGLQGAEEDALMRVDVVASDRIKDPDINGSIYLDPKTFQVRRTVLRLSKPVKQMRALTDFEVTTTFREIMPSIPVIGEVYSVQKLDPLSLSAFDTAYEEQHLLGVQFLRGKPGEQTGKKP